MDTDTIIKQAVEDMEAVLGVDNGIASFARLIELRKKVREKYAALGSALGAADMMFSILHHRGGLPGQAKAETSASQ